MADYTQYSIHIGTAIIMPALLASDGTYLRARDMLPAPVGDTTGLVVTDGGGQSYSLRSVDNTCSWSGDWGTGGFRIATGCIAGIWAVMRLDANGNPFSLTVYGGETNYDAYWSPGPSITYGYSDFDDILVEPDREWDESPTIDGLDEFGSFGGEYADTASWDATDLMAIDAMPDPQGQDYSHFITAYALTEANMQSLGLGLFSTGFWTNLKNRFEGLGNPIDFIISAIELPIATFNNYGTQTNFKLGGVEAEDDEGQYIAVSKLSSRYILRNCGTVRLKEVWGTGKDYSDISINIFLPYVGMKELDPDLVVGTDMYLQVQIDCWTGDIVYLLHVDNNSINGKYYRSASVPYRWTGNIATKIPIGKVDNTNAVMSAVNGIVSLGGAFAGAAAGAAIGGPVGAAAGFMAGGGANAMNIAQNGFRPSVQSSGGLSGASGIMDYQVAYLIVKRGVPQYPNKWREKIGAMRFQSYLGSQLSGYTLYKEIHLEGMEGAAEEEIDQLTRELCSEGIIL